MSDSSPAGTNAPDEGKRAETSDLSVGDRRGRFRRWLIRVVKGGLGGFFAGLVSGALVAFFLTPTGQAAWIAVRHPDAVPSCTNPLWLLQVPNSEVFASAYYEQRDQMSNYKLFHVASNTIDGDLGTSWLQSWPTTTTLRGPDYIEWSFAQPYRIRLMCVVDGWAEDTNTYTHTLPIGTATVYSTEEAVPPTSGSPSASGECGLAHSSFQDYMRTETSVVFVYQWQPITFDCTTTRVVLHIDSVSRASIALRQSLLQSPPLTGLSEVKFYYCPALLCGLSTS